MGGKNFGWLAVWVPSPDWLSHKGRSLILRSVDLLLYGFRVVVSAVIGQNKLICDWSVLADL